MSDKSRALEDARTRAVKIAKYFKDGMMSSADMEVEMLLILVDYKNQMLDEAIFGID